MFLTQLFIIKKKKIKIEHLQGVKSVSLKGASIRPHENTIPCNIWFYVPAAQVFSRCHSPCL